MAEAQLSGALKRGEVKKNVAAIHVSGKLTLLQRKLSNVLLLNAYDTLIHQQSPMTPQPEGTRTSPSPQCTPRIATTQEK